MDRIEKLDALAESILSMDDLILYINYKKDIIEDEDEDALFYILCNCIEHCVGIKLFIINNTSDSHTNKVIKKKEKIKWQ